MTTKVFISWSGDLSNKLADAIREWLPGVLQFVRPYFTPSDIEKGTKWSSDISGELESSNIGIICLTKDNLTAPWILFESGALSKNLENSKVCTILFGIESTDLKGPLTTFQNTLFEKNDFKKLIKSINKSGGERQLSDSVFNDVFDMWWDKLETKINKILSNHKNPKKSEQRSERDILEELLELSRLNARKNNFNKTSLHPQITRDIVDNYFDLVQFADQHGSKELRRIVSRLSKPVYHLVDRNDYKRIRSLPGFEANGEIGELLSRSNYNDEKIYSYLKNKKKPLK